MVDKKIANRVITVGSQYNNHRGGIGGVIDTYSKYFEEFNYLCSYGTTTNSVKITLNFIKALFTLVFILFTKRNIKIVHIHGAAKGSVFRKYIIFNISKRIFRKTVIFHSHASEMEKFYNAGGKLVKWICKDFFGNVDIIICLSRSWKQFFFENFNPKQIVILENIVEPAAHVETIKRSPLPVEFLFLGALGNRKGIFDLLDVLSNHKNEFEGKLKLVVGGNGEVEKFKNIVTKNQLQNLVDYKGWVSGELKTTLLANCDVYILPSYNEGLPLSILEAMTYGKPIISTNVGGISEILQSGENGCLIEAGNQAQIYNALKLFIETPHLIEEYGVKSTVKVKPYYADSVIPKLSGIYENLLK